MRGSLLVAGTGSDVGKSLLVAGIARLLARSGVRVAPFKAQNMSNNSMVCADGGEIGRAQWLQAVAAGVEPEVAMNPVLLKPGSDHTSHVVLLGEPDGELPADRWREAGRRLADAAYASFAELRRRFDVVVCEGAGSLAEVNLRDGDFVNLGLAARFGIPVVVVGDIDRGGVLAAMVGTYELLDAADRALLAGWIVNRFRGDRALLEPGLDVVRARTGLPVLGVVPWLDGVWLDAEDALATGGWSRASAGSLLRVAVVRLPRVSNATDVDALAAEPGVSVAVTADPDDVLASDVTVLPGTRATVADLEWLRERRIADAVAARARLGCPVLGICGGYQMLGQRIVDPVESRAGAVAGLGLLPVAVEFGAAKILGRPRGAWRGVGVGGYEIHHGQAHVTADTVGAEGFPGGIRVGTVWGTMWHGTFENDAFRRAWLAEIARQAGSPWTPEADAEGFAQRRTAMLDRLADAVAAHLDEAALRRILGAGRPENRHSEA
ncbi:MAG TPA: cobyric acid synthase [Streptosporangiales bacterium]